MIDDILHVIQKITSPSFFCDKMKRIKFYYPWHDTLLDYFMLKYVTSNSGNNNTDSSAVTVLRMSVHSKQDVRPVLFQGPTTFTLN